METSWQKAGGYVAVGLCCLVVGYFVGREHLKYELRTAFQSAAEQFQAGLTGAMGGSQTPAPSKSAAEEQPTPKPSEPSPLRATLLSKGFHNASPSAGDYEDAITFSVSFENTTGKDIRAFDGVLAFNDLLDNEVLSAKVQINESVKAGSSLNWDGVLDYNQFMDAHKRLRSEGKENLRVTFQPRKVLFADGTSKEFE